jgi:HSP20 family molecular chaperone IbpA
MAERASLPQQSGRSIASQASSAAAAPKFVEPQAIYDRMNELYEAIARRAFELFEGDGGISGRDLDHWFKAEAELLHPAHVQIRDSDDAIMVAAEVPGFSANELQVSLEPRRLTISGKKQSSSEQKKGSVLYSERCSNELLRSVELPVEVNTPRATATLDNGIFELTVPKLAAKNLSVQAKSAGAA